MVSTSIPGPKGKWLIGDTLEYEQDRLGWLERTRELYGDIVRLAPGTVVLHDPTVIRTVLTSPVALPGHATMTGRNSLQSPQWTASLSHVWRQLSRSVISEHLTRIPSTFSAHIRASSGMQRDIFEFTHDLCATATLDFCLGAEGPDPELVDAMKALSHSLIRASGKAEPTVRWLPRPAARQASRANAHLEALLIARVARRRSSPASGGQDLLGQLPPEMPTAQAAEVLRIVLMASPGSPAVAAAWAMICLATHDVALAPGDDRLTAAFLKEVLRLYPPNWLLARHTLSTMELGDYLAHAGTTILIPIYHLHRDRRWWHKPSDFDPGRWLEACVPHSPHAYLPLGAGRNTCPGGHLAMAHLTAFTQIVAQDYQLTLPALETIIERPEALLFPAKVQGRWDRVP